ncbi:hypothetical protein F511_17362 [Dorcoceras hygrometricum]|uniref:Uncharacterized protein n=1 Tax=Dorcoceras hygrometricum TaxID=472368 RepID=A0A2Z7AVZ1_9LAMI|nr:hypothetical protein F511_17362 [Dorcoceras hygrometricum]
MSLFDLQDVCIVIGSLATLDLPMVVDLIGIYVLKGPYCTLTTTNWFLQALSVIPRGSWGDVARRFTMIRWLQKSAAPFSFPSPLGRPLRATAASPLAGPHAAAVRLLRGRTCSDHVNEEILFVSNSLALLVQTDEGLVHPVVDRIKEIYRVDLVGARRLDASKVTIQTPYGLSRTVARDLSRMARAACGLVPHAVMVAAAARRFSGNAVTAVLSSRLCFGPVPCSP